MKSINKISISIIFVLYLLISAFSLFLSYNLPDQSFVFMRAVGIDRWSTPTLQIMLPEWIARTKLAISDFPECGSISARESISALSSLHEPDTTNTDRAITYLSQFINQGCDLNFLGKDGFSPLHGAIVMNNVSMVQFLVNNGATNQTKLILPDSVSANGLNPVEYADLLLSVDPGKETEEIISILRAIK